MHQALIDAATKTALVYQNLCLLYYKLVSMISMSYQINAYVKEPNKQALIYSNLHQNIQDVCNERGIMSPHYRAARDGNKTTIPETYRQRISSACVQRKFE
jgi:small-conductance mechanosensitive channel